ncbi:hypothetical protein T492DRAFT_877635 [Pavlovales sp. CCMP2436]|nr:hypothetical protein T492DRAFT_877635 [Pavlovales sp. CCMP2436]
MDVCGDGMRSAPADAGIEELVVSSSVVDAATGVAAAPVADAPADAPAAELIGTIGTIAARGHAQLLLANKGATAAPARFKGDTARSGSIPGKHQALLYTIGPTSGRVAGTRVPVA